MKSIFVSIVVDSEVHTITFSEETIKDFMSLCGLDPIEEITMCVQKEMYAFIIKHIKGNQ